MTIFHMPIYKKLRKNSGEWGTWKSESDHDEFRQF